MNAVFIGRSVEVLGAILEQDRILAAVVEERQADGCAARLARERAIPVHTVRSQADFDRLPAFEGMPVAVMCECGIILPEPFGRRFSRLVNIHPGLIPENRGRHPLPQGILHGHATMGVTAVLVDFARIDFGRILCRAELPIDYEASYGRNNERLRRLYAFVAREVARQLREERLDDLEYLYRIREDHYYPRLDGPTLERVAQAERLRDLIEE